MSIKSYNKDKNSPGYIHPYLRSIYGQLQAICDIWEGKTAWYRVHAYESRDIDDSANRYSNLNKRTYDREFRDVIWEKAQNYLPQETAEPDPAYLMRLKRSVFDRKFREFITGDLCGLLSKYSITQESRSLEANIDNVDGQGNSLNVFLADIDSKAARDGMVGVLTEMPKTQEFRSNSEAIAANIHPYWLAIERKDICNLSTEMRGSRKVITQAVIKREVEVPDGEFGVEYVERYRVYRLAEGSVLYLEYEVRSNEVGNQSENREVVKEIVDEGEIDLPFIPLTLYSLSSGDPFYCDIPLFDYVELNIEHYRLSSEIREALHLSNCPTPVINDIEGAAITYDTPNEVFVLGNHGVLRNKNVDKLEFEGRAISTTIEILDRVDKMMDMKGLNFVTGNHLAKTATEIEYNANPTESRLAKLAKFKESAFAQMGDHWSAFMGEDAPPRIEVDKDLIANISKLAPEQILDAMGTGTLSSEFGLRVLNENKAFGEQLPKEEIDQEINRSVFVPEDEEEIVA